MKNLDHKYWRDIIYSVGTHRIDRRLSPIEVSDGFIIAKKQGMSVKEISDLVDLDSSMVGRFIRLSHISSNIKHLIDWGWSDTTISFSVASELSSLPEKDQEKIIDSVLEYSLVKSEVIRILQIKKRSEKTIDQCVGEIIKMRPEVVKRYLFAGVITDQKLRNYISEISQLKRDDYFNKLLIEKIPPDIKWSARLGKKIFSIVGGAELNSFLRKLDPGYEEIINKGLLEKIENEE